jgi:hypothetical protein
MMETNKKDFATKLGEFSGDVLSAFILLGVCAAILWLSWNFSLVNCSPLTPIKYWESFLVITAYRSIVITKIK